MALRVLAPPPAPGEQAADRAGIVTSVLPPAPPPSPPVEANGLLFSELVAQMQTMLPALGWDVAAVADQLTRQGIPPPLGAQRWDTKVVDRCLVYASSLQHALTIV